MYIINEIGIEQIKRWLSTTHVNGSLDDHDIRELAHQAEARMLECGLPICQLPPEQSKTNTIANLLVSGEGLTKYDPSI